MGKSDELEAIGKTYVCETVEDTERLGESLGKILASGQVVRYSGGLGAGKTAFTRGIARGLGIEDRVTSPTFTIVQEYEGGRLPLFHFDFYRLGESLEEELLEELGFSEYFYRGGVSVIEWADLFPSSYWEEFPLVEVRISLGEVEGTREIFIAVEDSLQ